MISTRILRLTDVAESRIDWLWPKYIPLSALSILDGDPGCGKSLITVDLAARLTRGDVMPDGSTPPKSGRVLFLNAEDSVERVLLPRLKAANADLSRILCMDPTGPDGLFQLPRDLPELDRIISGEGIDLMVIDPIVAFLPATVAMSNDQSVRGVLSPLSSLAAKYGTTIEMVRHLNKTGGQRALYRGGGSIGIIGSARSSLLAAIHPHRSGCFALTSAKMNLDEAPPALTYRINQRDGIGAIEWLETEAMSADQLIRPEAEPVPGVFRAMEWLLAVLESGPRPAAELLKEASEAGIGERTLDRAKQRTGVTSRMQYLEGKRYWTWRLPEPQPELDLDPLPELEFLEDRTGYNGLPQAGKSVIDREQLKWAEAELKARIPT